MDIINQQLVIKEWPLKKVGQEMFFGYIVGLGVHTGDWCDETMYSVADFAYGNEYVRYRLPNDDALIGKLAAHLVANMVSASEGIYGKFWIKKIVGGYEMELP